MNRYLNDYLCNFFKHSNIVLESFTCLFLSLYIFFIYLVKYFNLFLSANQQNLVGAYNQQQYRSFPPRRLAKQSSFHQPSGQSYQQQQQSPYQYAPISIGQQARSSHNHHHYYSGQSGSGSGVGGSNSGGGRAVPNPCKLFVGNIPRTATLEDIISVFQRFGQIDEAHCAIKDNNYAFIHFYRREDAEQAQRELNNSLFMNRYIRVMFSNSTRTKGPNGSGNARSKFYISFNRR